MALHTGAEGEQLLKQFIFMAKNKVTLLNPKSCFTVQASGKSNEALSSADNSQSNYCYRSFPFNKACKQTVSSGQHPLIKKEQTPKLSVRSHYRGASTGRVSPEPGRFKYLQEHSCWQGRLSTPLLTLTVLEKTKGSSPHSGFFVGSMLSIC